MPVSGQFRSGAAAFSWQAWVPPQEKARLYFLPGMGSAPSECAPLGEALAAAGISVHSATIRGQGLDPEPRRRGTELDRAGIQGDLETWIAQTPANCPLFLGGESMGALLAIAGAVESSAIRRRMSGLILLCPVVELRRRTPPFIVDLVRLLARFFPRLSLHPGLFVHGKARAPKLTVDAAYQEFLASAPFRLPRVGLGFYAGMSALMQRCREAGPELALPTLVLGTRQDPYIAAEQTAAWFETISGPAKRLRLFPNSHHLLLRDPDFAEVIDAIQSFIFGNSPAGNGARDESR